MGRRAYPKWPNYLASNVTGEEEKKKTKKNNSDEGKDLAGWIFTVGRGREREREREALIIERGMGRSAVSYLGLLFIECRIGQDGRDGQIGR